MLDQRMNIGAQNLSRPAQWHQIAVHNQTLGAYAVKKIIKNSAVYVEGDIETRVFNDSINSEVKHVSEICIRHDGKIHLIKSGESISNISCERAARRIALVKRQLGVCVTILPSGMEVPLYKKPT